jgi:hypothetical protein
VEGRGFVVAIVILEAILDVMGDFARRLCGITILSS